MIQSGGQLIWAFDRKVAPVVRSGCLYIASSSRILAHAYAWVLQSRKGPEAHTMVQAGICTEMCGFWTNEISRQEPSILRNTEYLASSMR
jgi:hypothetical protein